jgi:hypothetical protein
VRAAFWFISENSMCFQVKVARLNAEKAELEKQMDRLEDQKKKSACDCVPAQFRTLMGSGEASLQITPMQSPVTRTPACGSKRKRTELEESQETSTSNSICSQVHR